MGKEQLSSLLDIKGFNNAVDKHAWELDLKLI